MASINQTQSAKLLGELICLATSPCPVDQDNPTDCVFHKVRKMEPDRRLGWFSSMSPDCLDSLAFFHHVCMINKLNPEIIPSKHQPGLPPPAHEPQPPAEDGTAARVDWI